MQLFHFHLENRNMWFSCSRPKLTDNFHNKVFAPPFALRQLISEHFYNLANLSSAQYAHVPYLVFLIKAVDEWSAQVQFQYMVPTS